MDIIDWLVNMIGRGKLHDRKKIDSIDQTKTIIEWRIYMIDWWIDIIDWLVDKHVTKIGRHDRPGNQ